MFAWVRNTPLVDVMGFYCFGYSYTLSFFYTDKIEKNVKIVTLSPSKTNAVKSTIEGGKGVEFLFPLLMVLR